MRIVGRNVDHPTELASSAKLTFDDGEELFFYASSSIAGNARVLIESLVRSYEAAQAGGVRSWLLKATSRLATG